MYERQAEVFENFDFDGGHVNQLGDRSPRYRTDGEGVDLSQTYRPFLEGAKEALEVDLVLNAVSQYGQEEIAQAPVEFLYTESWDEPMYEDLKHIIDDNLAYSDGKLNTVLAAYMNYDLSNSRGDFNTAGVLYTNAVIFAAGGAHIELGENMLSQECFSHKKLDIPDELHENLISYYDFMVVYQNLLRDGVTDMKREITTENEDVSITQDAEQGAIWNFSKKKANKEIIHLISFKDVTSMEWKNSPHLNDWRI